MPRGEANGRTWIAVHTGLLLGMGKLDQTELDRPGQGWAYLALICYSRERLTDGFVKAAEAERVVLMAGGADRRVTPGRRLADLVETGLLRRERWGYRIPDYDEWQQTKADVNALRERQSAKGKASARKRAGGSTGGATGGTPADEQRREREEIPLTPKSEGEEHAGGSPRQRGTNPRSKGTNPRAAGRPAKQLAAATTYVTNARGSFPEITADELEADLTKAYPLLTREQIGAIIHPHENGAT